MMITHIYSISFSHDLIGDFDTLVIEVFCLHYVGAMHVHDYAVTKHYTNNPMIQKQKTRFKKVKTNWHISLDVPHVLNQIWNYVNKLLLNSKFIPKETQFHPNHTLNQLNTARSHRSKCRRVTKAILSGQNSTLCNMKVCPIPRIEWKWYLSMFFLQMCDRVF